jgi:peptide/nickel transport system permease protein
MSDVAVAAPSAPSTSRRRRGPWELLLARTWGQGRAKVGLTIVGILVLIAILGPLFAPYAPDESIRAHGTFATPFNGPSSDALLGTDNLGRDVLSRFLNGGRSVLALSALATAIAIVLGVTVGLVAAYWRGRLDDLLMRAMDVIIAFPVLVLALVAVATVGPKIWVIVVSVGLATMPRIARVSRGAGAEVVERDFVRAAEALGQRRAKIVIGELLPNIMSPLIVESALRFTYSIAVIAALSFVGFGLQPPAADWGLMINENRQGLEIQPWGVVVPVVAIALLTIGTSLVGDALARAAVGIERGEGHG